jgi:REP element-mobilizing transposase RayT
VNEQSKRLAAPSQLPHSKNLRINRWNDASATLFITKSLHPKKPILDADARALVTSAFRFALMHGRIYLRAFVAMPDHRHALFALREAWTLPRFMHNTMSFVGSKTSRLLSSHDTNWQDGYYDTRVKTAKQFAYIAYYIEQNPVMKGLVESQKQWDASTASCKELVTDPWPLIYE